MTDMDQLDENIKAMTRRPSPTADQKLLAMREELIRAVLLQHVRQVRRHSAATGCRSPTCCASRTYADGYGQFALGRERFQELSAEHAAVRCGDCPGCTVQCPHGVKVADRLIRAQELFAC